MNTAKLTAILLAAAIILLLAVLYIALSTMRPLPVEHSGVVGTLELAKTEGSGDESAGAAEGMSRAGVGTEPRMKFTKGLTLLAELRDLSVEERQKRIGQILLREKVAPVARFYSSDGPDAIYHQIPALGPDTPPVPSPPKHWTNELRKRWEDYGWRAEARAGRLSAALYGWYGCTDKDPVELLVRYGKRGEEAQLRFELASTFSLNYESGLVIYGDGDGLLVLMVGDGPPYRETPRGPVDYTSTWEVRIYLCEAPDWRPRILYRMVNAERDLYGSRIAGQTIDGSSVWILVRGKPSDPIPDQVLFGTKEEAEALRGTYSTEIIPDQLLEVDTSTGAWTELATARRLPHRFIPSPAGRFLAAGGGYSKPHVNYLDFPYDEHITLIDRGDGTVTSLREGRWSPGRYVPSAVAWSADVPGRLYFTDEQDRLWRVDLPAGGSWGDHSSQ